MSRFLDRCQGCLLGQAIGDALGTTYEFQNSRRTAKLIDIYKEKDGFLPIVGEGPFSLVPGQVTDDTELALGLARSLVKQGKFDRHDVAKAYLAWYHSPPFDIGNTTTRALAKAGSYEDLVNNAKTLNAESLSNGSMMRISPLAIWGAHHQRHVLAQYVKQDVQMTHSHPVVIDGVTVYVLAIRDALRGLSRKEIYQRALEHAQTDQVKRILKDSLNTPYSLVKGERVENDSQLGGYFGVALQNTFYEFLTGQSFYDSLVNIISRGGDTDTNGAIAGAFLGAYYSLSNMPQPWVQTVLQARNSQREKEYPQSKTRDLLDLAKQLAPKTNS